MTAVALVGVTASGKSSVAMEVALRRGDCEIVSVDSMCVYRGMDLGTAKPSVADRASVPHHLVDIVDPDQEFTVSEYAQLVHDAVEGIGGRGHHALLVGGTGLYHRAVIDHLEIPGQFPPVATELRGQLERGDVTVESLHARLVELDPVAAARMEANNERRVVRALEVTLGSGRPFSSFGPGLGVYPEDAMTQVGLSVDWAVLDERVALRFETWMDEGFLDEVRALAARPAGLSRTARQALGYRELLRHVEEGCALDDMVAEAVTRTRQFARRQARWFRRDPRITWSEGPDEAGRLLEQALEAHD
jgi:tRNA dimethylallyltransferase